MNPKNPFKPCILCGVVTDEIQFVKGIAHLNCYNKMIHTLNDYQAKALSFRMESANDLYAVLNLSGEVGELHSLMAKAIRDGRKPDYDQNVKKELGDALWSIAAIAADNGFTLSDIANSNIFKLESRSQRGTISGSGDNR